MMKTTQFIANIKVLQNVFFAFTFLFSLSIFSQVDATSAVVGDELTFNGMLQTDGDEGVTGSGTGCAPCGWNAIQGTNYAPTNNNNNNGACHSENRQFKMFATNGNNGSFVNQEITNLPAGTFTYDYWTKWAGVPTYTDENGDTLEPKFTIRVLQADGSYSVVKEEVIPLSDDQVWSQTTGTWENTEAGATVRLQWYKRGGTTGAPTGLNKSMFVDSVSFTFTAAASNGESIPWTDSFETTDVWTNDGSYPWTYGLAQSYETPPSAAQDGTGVVYFDDYSYSTGNTGTILSPEIDLSSATDPIVSFYHYDGTANGNSDTVEVVDGTGAVIFTTPAVADEWTKHTVSLSAYVGGTVQVGFKGTSVYGYSNPHIDNVYVGETPTEPTMSVSSSTDGGSATFSFTLENFTVGSDASADGHIHYSLNGGTEVMVYSSDDLTLTDLPNGDHTIVFSLVDANHTALDPAVTATVEFSTFDGTVACDGSLSHTYGNNESGTLFSASNPGGTVTVTVTGQTEGGYDFLIIRDGAGNELYNASGDHTGQAITSEDGTLTVEVDSDSSVSGYALDFAVTCGTLQANVTFTVNTANITVGDNGMYLGGGVFGGATAHAMSDADGDGTWEVTVAMDPGTTGNYIFLNSPNSDSDWGTKENLEGQDCADPANYNDRILPAIDGDMTIQHCFGSCESDGTCPAATPTYDVTFSVDMSNYPTGVGANDTVYLNGNFSGWCGDCNPMSDDDGDGIWTLTIPLEDGAYEYKFTVNGWDSQEEFTEVVEGCTVSDGTYTNRTLTVAGEDMTLPTVYWNLCAGETPGETFTVTFSVNTSAIVGGVGANGIYAGGGVLGNAQALQLSDDDGDGVWVGSVDLPAGTTGNYIFLNSPGDGGDWGTKENLEGQDCADPNNYNDRILPEVTADVTYLACFGECSGDGTGQCSADECAAPDITSWTMTGDGAIFDGNNQDGIIGYQIEYSTSTFTPGDGTAIVYEFDTFPHTLTGLESNTTYYFTVRSICGDDNYSDWTDYGDDGPDAWTTTICPSSYSLPYLNDFNDPDTWTNCQTFYDNDGDGNFWYYVNYTDVDEAGNNVAASASYQSGAALTPDNWVIMGPIDLTDHSDALLEWKVRGIDPSWCQENYSVYVGTSDNYNDLINGSVSYNETIANGGDACGQTFAERSLDISASTGGQVYIGFRHHDVSDMFVLNVDDISVTSTTMSNEDFTLENITYSFNQETDILRVTSEEPLSKIEIYNMLGQQVLNKNLNESSATLNLSDLSSAIYIVNVEGNNSKTKTFKLAIK